MSLRGVVGSSTRSHSSVLEQLESRVLFASGDLDPTFGINLDNALGNVGQDIVTLPNGKIIVVGRTSNDEFVLFRNNTNGNIDTTFGTDVDNAATVTGIANRTLQARRVFSLPSGKIVVVGEQFDPVVDPETETSDDARIVFARYSANGVPDNTFGTGGVKISTIGGATFGAVRDVAMQKDGKFIAVGKDGNAFVVLRYLANGNVDNTFGNKGVVRITFVPTSGFAFADAVAVQKDGKILVGGTANQDAAGNGGICVVVRLTSKGKFDTGFGSGGVSRTTIGAASVITSLAVQASGKIVAGASSGDNILTHTHGVVLRYNTNGRLDKTFGKSGQLAVNVGTDSFVTQVASDATGRVLFSGYTDNFQSVLVGNVLATGKAVDPGFNPIGGNGSVGGFAALVAKVPVPQAQALNAEARQIHPLEDTGDEFLNFINESRSRIIPQKGKILVLVNTTNGTQLARVFNDSIKPSIVLVTANNIVKKITTFKFTVKFSDNIAVQVSSLGDDDFLVNGPGFGVATPVTFVKVDKPKDGSPRIATYRITGPAGNWGSDSDGTYTIKLTLNSVSDQAQNFVKSKVVKSFKVQVPGPKAAKTAEVMRATDVQDVAANDVLSGATSEDVPAEQAFVAAALFSTNAVAPLYEDDLVSA